jgi:hypothetical protein
MMDDGRPEVHYTEAEVAALREQNETLQRRCDGLLRSCLGVEDVSRRLKVDSIEATDPMWSRLEKCRERCLNAGKADLLPMIFALEEVVIRLPPKVEWEKYGENPTAALRELAVIAENRATSEASCDRLEIELGEARAAYRVMYYRHKRALAKLRKLKPQTRKKKERKRPERIRKP